MFSHFFKTHKGIAPFLAIPTLLVLSLTALRLYHRQTDHPTSAPRALQANNPIEMKPSKWTNIELLQRDADSIRQIRQKRDHEKIIHLDLSKTEKSGREEVFGGAQPLPMPSTGHHVALPNAVHSVSTNGPTVRSSTASSFTNKPPPLPKRSDQPSADFNSYAAKGNADVHSDKSLTLVAVVFGDQKIVDGGIIRMRTLHNQWVNGALVPSNTIAKGIVTIEAYRTMIHLSRIVSSKGLLQLNLVGYGDDGRAGLALSQPDGNANDWAESGKNTAIDQASTAVPLAQGVISSIGRKLVKKKNVPSGALSIGDGKQITFKEE